MLENGRRQILEQSKIVHRNNGQRKSHTHTHRIRFVMTCLLLHPSGIQVIGNIRNRKLSCLPLPTQLVPSSITVSRDAEVSDKNTYQMATSFPRNWENLSRENYDTHARFTTFFFSPGTTTSTLGFRTTQTIHFPGGVTIVGFTTPSGSGQGIVGKQ